MREAVTPAPLCFQNWADAGRKEVSQGETSALFPSERLGNLGATNLGTSELQGLPSSCEPTTNHALQGKAIHNFQEPSASREYHPERGRK